MCIYCGTNSYRKIYQHHHGAIPKGYDIHHIDGNHSNHNPKNLQAVSITEHYDIHYQNGDWKACLIMSARMKITPDERSLLSSKSNADRVANNTHHFQTGDIQRKTNRKRLENGTHLFLDSELQRAKSVKRVKDGTHNFLGGELQRASNNKRVKDGTHHLLGGKQQLKQLADGNHSSQVKWKCHHCKKSGSGSTNYKRWHGVNCKLKVD